MIRPEAFAVEGERAGRKWDRRQVFDSGFLLLRVEPRDPPFLFFPRNILVLVPAQDITGPVDKGMAANFRADLEGRGYFAVVVDLLDLALIPLTQLKSRPI